MDSVLKQLNCFLSKRQLRSKYAYFPITILADPADSLSPVNGMKVRFWIDYAFVSTGILASHD